MFLSLIVSELSDIAALAYIATTLLTTWLSFLGGRRFQKRRDSGFPPPLPNRPRRVLDSSPDTDRGTNGPHHR